MARTVVLNAKMRRTGVCGAAETLLVDRDAWRRHPAPIIDDLLDGRLRSARRRRDARRSIRASCRRARTTGAPSTWTPIISVKLVDGVDAAIAPYQPLRLASHRRDRHRRRGGGRALPRPGRQRHRAAQRLDPVRRRRRVRHGRRDRHLDRPAARARPGRRRAADHLQIRGPRQRTDPALTTRDTLARPAAAPRDAGGRIGAARRLVQPGP